MGFKFIKSDDSGLKLGTYKILIYIVMSCKITNNVGWSCRRKLETTYTYVYTYTCTCMQACKKLVYHIHTFILIHVHVWKHASLKIIKQKSCQ